MNVNITLKYTVHTYFHLIKLESNYMVLLNKHYSTGTHLLFQHKCYNLKLVLLKLSFQSCLFMLYGTLH